MELIFLNSSPAGISCARNYKKWYDLLVHEADRFLRDAEHQLGIGQVAGQPLIRVIGQGVPRAIVSIPIVKHVAFVATRRAVERAKVTNCGADIGVVNIAIDVVGAIALRVQTLGHFVGRCSECCQVMEL